MVQGQVDRVASDGSENRASAPRADEIPDAIGPRDAGKIFGRSDEWARQAARDAALPCVITTLGPKRRAYTYSRAQLERIAAAQGAPAIAALRRADPPAASPAAAVSIGEGAIDDAPNSMSLHLELAEHRIQELERELLLRDLAAERARAEEATRELRRADKEILRLNRLVASQVRAHEAYVRELRIGVEWTPTNED